MGAQDTGRAGTKSISMDLLFRGPDSCYNKLKCTIFHAKHKCNWIVYLASCFTKHVIALSALVQGKELARICQWDACKGGERKRSYI